MPDAATPDDLVPTRAAVGAFHPLVGLRRGMPPLIPMAAVEALIATAPTLGQARVVVARQAASGGKGPLPCTPDALALLAVVLAEQPRIDEWRARLNSAEQAAEFLDGPEFEEATLRLGRLAWVPAAVLAAQVGHPELVLEVPALAGVLPLHRWLHAWTLESVAEARAAMDEARHHSPLSVRRALSEAMQAWRSMEACTGLETLPSMGSGEAFLDTMSDFLIRTATQAVQVIAAAPAPASPSAQSLAYVATGVRFLKAQGGADQAEAFRAAIRPATGDAVHMISQALAGDVGSPVSMTNVTGIRDIMAMIGEAYDGDRLVQTVVASRNRGGPVLP